MSEDERADRRVQELAVPNKVIFSLLTNQCGLVMGRPLFVRVPVIPGLPKDARVVYVYNDPGMDCFIFRLHSMEWEVVPPGMRAPCTLQIEESELIKIFPAQTAEINRQWP